MTFLLAKLLDVSITSRISPLPGGGEGIPGYGQNASIGYSIPN